MNDVKIEMNGIKFIVSDDGTVTTEDRVVDNYPSGVRTIKGRRINGAVGNHGYRYYTVNRKTNRKNILLHRIIALARISNPTNLPYVNHIDGVKTNNHPSNLEWCTHKENMRHAFDLGLATRRINPKGEKSISSKLTDNEVIKIKKQIKRGEKPKEIAMNYCVGASAIREIKAGRSWAHIL